MIEAVAKQRAKRRYPMQPSCTEEEIARLRAASKARLGVEPPARYLDLLRITNGINENGLYVYASREARDLISDVSGREFFMFDFVKENEGLRLDRPGYDRLLIVAYKDLYICALDMTTGKYVMFPHIGSKPDEVFDTFDELMIAAFSRILMDK